MALATYFACARVSIRLDPTTNTVVAMLHDRCKTLWSIRLLGGPEVTC